MQVYINCPNPHFTFHKDASCQQIRTHRKDAQRIISVSSMTLNNLLNKFINNAYEFKSQAQLNDLWLDISLSSPEREIGFVKKIQAILGQRYRPLGSAPITEHC
jgi:hypothetical protein